MTSEPTQLQAAREAKPSRSISEGDRRWGWLLVAPTVVLLVAVGVVPLLYSIWASFVAFNLRTEGNPFVGFDNYTNALSDPVFRRNLIFTFVIAAVVTVIEVLLGTTLALLLAGRSKSWRRILIPLIVAPMFISAVVVGQIWRLFTARTFGPLNYMLERVPGIDVTVD